MNLIYPTQSHIDKKIEIIKALDDMYQKSEVDTMCVICYENFYHPIELYSYEIPTRCRKCFIEKHYSYEIILKDYDEKEKEG